MNPTDKSFISIPENGPLGKSNQERRSERYRKRANDLWQTSLTAYLGLKNKWLCEHEIAALTPACINEISRMYKDEFKDDCPWFPEQLTNEQPSILSLENETFVQSHDMEVPEFKPIKSNGFCESEEVAIEVEDLPSIIPVSKESETCTVLEVEEHSEFALRSIENKEIDAIISNSTPAVTFNKIVADFPNNWHLEERVNPLLAFKDASKANAFYGTTFILGKLIAHCECSFLVRSPMGSKEVLISGLILKTVATLVSIIFMTICLKFELFNDPSIGFDNFSKTGKKFRSRRTRIDLTLWLMKIGKDVRRLPDDLKLKYYKPRPPRGTNYDGHKFK